MINKKFFNTFNFDCPIDSNKHSFFFAIRHFELMFKVIFKGVFRSFLHTVKLAIKLLFFFGYNELKAFF